MSYYVNLTANYRSSEDWASCEFESPETLADLSFWHIPLRVEFDDAAKLRRFLARLDDEHTQTPDEVLSIRDVRDGDTITRLSWPQVRVWLLGR